jgi:hypothetical protein
MAKLVWDKTGERYYETGVNKGVLYIPDENGVYDTGVAWNGLTTVTESPSGAEATPLYADNIKYLNLISAEEFGATVEAYTYPDEFAQFDGVASPSVGVYVGQQSRRAFGLSYQTRVGNDVEGSDLGYKIHLIYGAQAAPSEKAYATINDTPEAITFSWELTTTPVDAGDTLKPTAQLVIDSTKVDPDDLATLEAALYGSASTSPRLPLPTEVIDMFSGTSVEVTTTAPTYNASTDIITIPAVTGVVYTIDGDEVPAGPYGPITTTTVVNAVPAPGYRFSPTSDNDWTIVFS